MKFVPGSLSVSVQCMTDKRPVPLKMVLSNGDTQTTLDYMEFRKTRSGLEEVEITTVGTHPLGITLVLPLNHASVVTATISTNLPGQNIREVAKACAALKLLQKGCTLELTSLQLNDRICTLSVDPLPLPFTSSFLKFVEDLAVIAARFGVNFPMPTTLKLTREEEETFMILRALALNEPLEVDRFTATFTKCPENAMVVPQQFRDEIVLRMEHEDVNATLFGAYIRVGPTRILIDRAKVIQFAATMKKFITARMGANIPIQLHPLVPIRFELVGDCGFAVFGAVRLRSIANEKAYNDAYPDGHSLPLRANVQRGDDRHRGYTTQRGR